MFTQVASLFALATVSAALTLDELCPAYPICDNALIEAYRSAGLLEEGGIGPLPYSQYELNVAQEHHNIAAASAGQVASAAWYQQQLNHQQASLNHIAFGIRKKRSLPLPGTASVAALAYNPPAEAQWYQQQQLWQQQQVNAIAQQLGAAGGKKKRSLPAPGTPAVAALVPNSPAEAQWYQQQQLWQQLQVNAIAQQLGAAGGKKKRSLPTPGTPAVAALVPNSPAEAQWYQQQQLWQQLQVNAIAQQLGAAGGKKKRSLPAPGTPAVAALVPNSPAEAQWYQQQQLWQQLQVNAIAQQLGAASGKKKRSLPAPGTPAVAALVPNSPAEAQWYQQQLLWQQLQVNAIAQQLGAASGKKKRSLPAPGTPLVAALVPNSPAEAQWYQQQLLWQQQQVNWSAQQIGAASG